MTPIRSYILLIAVLFAGAACEKKVIYQGDKQIRFDFPSVATDGATWITHGYMNTYNFNIDYYRGVDSVFLSVWALAYKPGGKGTIELYNITDSVVITGSLIEVSHHGVHRLFRSANLVNNFPNKEITLGLRLSGPVDGGLVQFTKSSLLLYRK